MVGASKGNTFENDILKLFFNATAIADLATDDQFVSGHYADSCAAHLRSRRDRYTGHQ